MQIDALQTLQPGFSQEDLARRLGALLTHISSLRLLTETEEDGEGEGQYAFNLPRLREGLGELEQMASELVYELQAAGGELLLADLPDIPLAEALSQLVESTAEAAGVSSRVAFSGREQPLPNYLARLLYQIARETLARVPTHEGARRLRFNLNYQLAEVTMSIEDDGVPGEQLFENLAGETVALPPFLNTNQVGSGESVANAVMRRLRGIVEGLGGALTITSSLEQGTQTQVRLPYRLLERAEKRSETSVNSTQEAMAEKVSARIKVLIVDDQAVSRAGLRRLLESYPDLEVVAEASDSMQAVSETAELLPQVVLIDAHLPGEQSLETLRQLRQLNAEIHTLLLADREYEELLYEALREGVGGYILKDIVPDELARSVRAVARGEVLVQPQLAARLLTRFGGQERRVQESLTAREHEVLQLLARGLRNKEIAARLTVSERTVNFHLANIYAKLHVSGRTEALSKALEQGLLKV